MTPKTLDKYIAKAKKQYADGIMTHSQYMTAITELHKQLVDQYYDNKITDAEYQKANSQIINAKNNPDLLGKKSNGAAQTGTSATTAPAMKPASMKPAKDPGQQATDAAVQKLEKELKKVYKQAQKEMQAKLQAMTSDYADKYNQKLQDLADGKITKAQFDAWADSQVKYLETWQKKIDQCAGVMLHANEKAVGMVNGQAVNVFADNANWQSFQLTKDTGMDLSFAIYDESTVERLIKEKPELLPRKEVNGKKDKAWNKMKIANAVTQAIIQGESIPALAKRVAAETASQNDNAMMRYARTAMTSAQNSGRIEMLHRAEGMGISVKKVWLATLDSHTRDSHQHMDGKKAAVDDKFSNGLLFPGDPNGPPAEVYNCRCTLIYDYEGFPSDPTKDQRYDQESGQLIANMTYDEWKTVKKGGALNDLNVAKYELAEAQKEYIKKKVSETKQYEGIWKDPVTLSDYPDKMAAIPAKRDYFTNEIQKYKDAQANGASWATDDKIKELQKKLKLLNEFEKHGEILKKRNEALKKVQDIYSQVGYQGTAAAPMVGKAKKTAKKAAPASGGANTGSGGQTGAGLNLSTAGEKKTPFTPDAYSQERKDKALWTTDKHLVDGIMRQKTGEMWRNATPEEREAIHEYTYTYKKFNEPLRGIEYGTSRYLGVGNTDLNAGYKRSGRKLNAITDLLDKCSYDHDMWLQRGVRFDGMDKFFNVPRSLLETGTEAQLKKALLGTTPTEYAFGSMGSAKGEGFTGDIIMNIYAPKGTKMLYAEPWSYYGHDKQGRLHEMDGAKWDGRSTQPNYGTEFETILQQGTQFRVTKVERRGNGTIFVDLEVINQDNQQRWKP